MTPPKRPLKVFLCHAHADRDAVRALYTRLTTDGVDAWLDKEKLLPGQDWEFEIKKSVREADVVVVCLSKQFNQAGFRQKEVRWALDTAMEKPEGEPYIIPARLEECGTLESLRRLHWVDLFELHGYKTLLKALKLQAIKKQLEIGINSKVGLDNSDLNRIFHDLNGKRIISFHSRSEDSGHLSVIANLAAQMAIAGKRVGIVDMDALSSGFYFHLGLDDVKINKTMKDFLHDEAFIREVGIPIHEILSEKIGLSQLRSTKIWLFPFDDEFDYRKNQISTEGLNYYKVADGLIASAKEYDLDCVLVNSGSILDDIKLYTIGISDTVVLVSRPTSRDFQYIALVINIAQRLDIARQYIIFNKVPNFYDSLELKEYTETSLETSVISMLYTDEYLENENDKDIYSLLYPDRPWSKNLLDALKFYLDK